ncbi:lytic transglycosylase domain-containing protein [Kinneretia asaccharophila]|uniref:Transglycosylase-like protein with SLT domain n=1 Tax=Roseateles asaccharophilus TaxID=582607 RepID=A0A4R6N404_9BURK|nr:lytic transglycosylase domain-containing protein [Roseateles asaccharophilus]MDN3544696.1 lytic transglycosylase domain-containing protein [Roseateles asaccharophilus]TDP09537.1 transglycosylase-like protein with SLT domain [Roseateles asaccharophilus]
MTARQSVSSLTRGATAAATLFVKDIGQGLLVVSHNTLALLGLAVVAVLLMFSSQADLRHKLETEAFGWLNARQEARAEASGNTLLGVAEPEALARATAADPKELTRQQAAVAMWLSRRYKVAPEPISRLVQEAWVVGQRARVEPTLILAIMAIESGFNPFAQSAVGAQGLMQVMTRVHDDKYEAFGGNLAAFDPITNLRVGVQVLKECIQRAGSLEEGLRYYVGAANLPDDAGYANRVLAEHEQMKSLVTGRSFAPATAGAEKPSPKRDLKQEQLALLE